MKENWKSKLTPFDTELAIMVESATGKPCELKNGGTHFYFHADYENHIGDPEYLLAVWDAIEGRIGKRCISMKDDAENHVFIVRVKFSKENFPGLVYLDKDARPCIANGDTYFSKKTLPCVWALQVTRQNVNRLLKFVGSGEMEIERCPGGKMAFHFRNACGSVLAHAPEFSYIVHVRDGLFNVVDQEIFERDYVKGTPANCNG